MSNRIRFASALVAFAVAVACLSAPTFAAPGNGVVQVKPKPPKPVRAPEIGAEGAAAALLLTLGGIAVMTGRRRRIQAR